jgi:RND family efflux transporter MFP subunit
MNKKTLLILSTAVIGLFAIAAIKIVLSRPADRKPVIAPVRVQPPKQESISSSLVFNGDVTAYQQAGVFARVQGNILSITKDIGDYVKAGEVLARIDDTPYQQQLRQAEGQYVQSSASYENASDTYLRSKDLNAQQLISKQDFETAETNYRVAKAKMEADKASLDNAKLTLSYCTITAPFSGYITKRYYDAGAYIGTNAVVNSVSSTTIFILTDLSKVKLVVNVLEKDIPQMQKLTEGIVKVDAYPDKPFKGKVTRRNQAVDLNTRTLAVQLVIDNNDLLLKPGMFATVSLMSDERHEAIILPKEAVLSDDKGSYVMKAVDLTSQPKAKKTPVKIGMTDETRVEVSEGVTLQDKIITTGQENVKDGAAIRIAE